METMHFPKVAAETSVQVLMHAMHSRRQLLVKSGLTAVIIAN